MKKRMKKVATLCLAGVTAMSTVGVTGSAVFAKGDTNYDVESIWKKQLINRKCTEER